MAINYLRILVKFIKCDADCGENDDDIGGKGDKSPHDIERGNPEDSGVSKLPVIIYDPEYTREMPFKPVVVSAEELPGENNSTAWAFYIMPNPVKNVLTIVPYSATNGSLLDITIKNMADRQYYNGTHKLAAGADEKLRLNIETLPAGMYIINIPADNGGLFTAKFVKINYYN